ncbi:hypothetical protein [Dictyobacter kobayashii]|uniref:Uncharacterized protein n=1 Tax=Dictyobacter kobayashii TaxID=2014872 RepID=A0A402AUY7_9CHLR|nr:hypothetical protein [Dictyobacter kobayashii]GCE22922.1 hypothetical protein KDK_67220 [Dictyobacter kobayashii]
MQILASLLVSLLLLLPAAVVVMVTMVVVVMFTTIEIPAIKVSAHIGAAEEKGPAIWAIVAVAHPTSGSEQAAQGGEKYNHE